MRRGSQKEVRAVLAVRRNFGDELRSMVVRRPARLSTTTLMANCFVESRRLSRAEHIDTPPGVNPTTRRMWRWR